jgi:uncharacterized protein (DUF1778 family)
MSALQKNHIINPHEENQKALDEVDNLVVLSDRDRDIFLAMLESDEEPNDLLKRAFAGYKQQKV